MAYSEVGDLLLGDIIIGSGVDRQKFIDQSADDMDAKLGWLYHLPLRPMVIVPAVVDPTKSWKDLPTHEQLTLKGINNKMASGRLILTLDIAGEGQVLHGYGWQLIRDSTAELLLLANGDAWLTADRVNPQDPTQVDNRGPSIVNGDDESQLLGFENTVMRGLPWRSRPGVNAGKPNFNYWTPPWW